jgi:redox-sensing transcriptional repressor
MEKQIPRPTLERFPKYYQVASSFLNKYNELYISSVYLAECLSMDDSQVRRDMMYLDIGGKPRVGYNAEELRNTLAHYLGYFNLNEALLVGTGHLGKAIAAYKGFEDYGLRIIGLFDVSEEEIGKKIGKVTVQPLSKMKSFVPKHNIRIGIITTPESSAQSVVDMMIAAGIKAVWNFAPLRLHVPEDIFVQDENLAESFSFISHFMKQFEKKKANKVIIKKIQ